MPRQLMSAAEFHKAVYCFETNRETGERIEYDIITRKTRIERWTIGDQVMVKVRLRGDRTNPGDWRLMNRLTYVMPDGSYRA
jgi:hypothetical protein